MKVWVYVEGPSDRLALEALWENWREELRPAGHGIAIMALGGKFPFFRKIGGRAAEKLLANNEDIVIGLPDLYPNQPFSGTDFEHKDILQLKQVQEKLVKDSLIEIFGAKKSNISTLLNRFLPTALKHDLEMLLLAAKEELRNYLGARDKLGSWRHPVEEQDQDKPPKRIVENLFITKTKKKRAYRDTIHAPGVLRRVSEIRSVLFNEQGQVQCPVFKNMLDWIVERTGVPAYST